jgi:hypothetical protein
VIILNLKIPYNLGLKRITRLMDDVGDAPREQIEEEDTPKPPLDSPDTAPIGIYLSATGRLFWDETIPRPVRIMAVTMPGSGIFWLVEASHSMGLAPLNVH